MKRHREGFTLIELMVVVAIIAIIFAIAVPSFVSFISRYRATAAINDFLQGVTLTRSEALKRGQRVLMLPNASNGTPSTAGSWVYGWTVFVDNNKDQIYQSSSDELIFQHSALPPSITTVGANGGEAFMDDAGKKYVQFDGTGYARVLPPATKLGVGIVITDNTGSSQNIRTLCLALFSRPRVMTGTSTCTSG